MNHPGADQQAGFRGMQGGNPSVISDNRDSFTRNEYIWMFLILLAVLLVTQLYVPGIAPGHRGWMHSEHLAIARSSTLEQYGVGATAFVLTPEGGVRPEYSSRAPFLFGFLVSSVLNPIQDKLALTIYTGQQIMNIVFAVVLILIIRLTAPFRYVGFSHFTQLRRA